MVQQNVEPAQQDTSPETIQAPAEQEEQYLYYRLEDFLAGIELQEWKNSGVPLHNVDCGAIDTNLEILNIGGNEIPMPTLDKLRRIIDEELDSIAFSSVDERGFHFGAQLNLPGDDEGGLIYKLTLPLSAQGNPAIERDTNQDTSASDEVSD